MKKRTLLYITERLVYLFKAKKRHGENMIREGRRERHALGSWMHTARPHYYKVS
jgi:hypothetical protein